MLKRLKWRRLLAKHRAFSEAAGQSLIRGLAQELMLGAHDAAQLHAAWNQLDADELQSQVEQLSCTRLAEVESGRVIVAAGRLRAVVYTPSENVPTLEAELFDGSGSIALVWLGRRRIVGIEPGRRIIVRGRVGEHLGRPAIYNPWYELQCGP